MSATQTLKGSLKARTGFRIAEKLEQVTLDMYPITSVSAIARSLLTSAAWHSSQPATADPYIARRLELLSGLDALRKDDYDEDFLAPTEYAYTSARNFLLVAFETLENALPIPFYVPDGEGGIRIEWMNGTRELGLICAASESRESYLYHEDGADYGVDELVTESILLNRLRWLIGE